MTASCQLCGQIIRAEVTHGRYDAIVTSEEQRVLIEAARQVREFDLLAGFMANHISLLHREPQALEMAAVANLAAKVYAMTHAESATTPGFEKLRESWRTTILAQLSGVDFQATGGGATPATGAASPSDESNEKKSARKDSI